MTIFIVRRMLQSVALLWIASMIAFLAVFLIGNPIDILISEQASEAERLLAIKSLGLDLPLWQQYLNFLGNILQLDFGKSFMTSLPVGELLLQRLPATVELTIAAFLLSLLGLPLGVLAGLYPNSIFARITMPASILGFSLPSFWVGLMLILVFSVLLGWLPSTGRGQTVPIFGVPFALTTDGLRHLILPAITLSLFNIALLIRLARTGMREILTMDYIRFARAKGLREKRVIWVHALKNILIPVITVQGVELAQLMTGALVVEQIFAYPGIGRLAIDAINTLDRPVLVAYLIFSVAIFVIVNLVVDILYGIADPRVRVGGDNG
jgi:peptide/nickel transport system permease protein